VDETFVGIKQDAGDGKMKEISDYIYEGALAFLKAEYRLLAIFVVIASVVLAGITQIRCANSPIHSDCFWCLLFGFSWKYGNENSN
jgi:Na+/H+-translocating membrane pyrophosphatase